MAAGTCIYCKSIVDDFSREHAVQYALGGNLTLLEEVCFPCNNGLSSIDRELIENSLPAMARVAFADKSARRARLGGEHFHLDERSGVWKDAALVNGMQMVLLPHVQLERAADGEGGQVGIEGSEEADIKALVTLIDKRLADGSLLQTHIKVGPAPYGDTSRLVGHRSKDMFVRAATMEAGRVFLETLAVAWPKVRQQVDTTARAATTIEQPSLQIRQSFHLNRTYRAVAKIAFNVLAAKRGAEFVLRSEFDPIRNYIRGVDELVLGPMPKGQVMVDPRFVDQLPFGSQVVPTKSHAVTIFYSAPTLLACVTLYENHSFFVRLTARTAHRDLWDRRIVTTAIGMVIAHRSEATVSVQRLA